MRTLYIDVINLYNCKRIFQKENPIKKSRVYGRNNINEYMLLESLQVILSNGDIILIPSGFVWDLASVPRWLWSLIPPDNDAELAFLIHDYLYTESKRLGYSQKFCDNEMKIWSKELNGTKKLFSARNFDNQTRYIAIRLFGKKVFNKNLK